LAGVEGALVHVRSPAGPAPRSRAAAVRASPEEQEEVTKEKVMATKKKSSPRSRARARVKTDRAQAAGQRLRETWNATVKVLTSAEAVAERRIRQLLARQRGQTADLHTHLATSRAAPP